MIILEIIGGLLILVLLVVIHELGHAYAAVKNGVIVEEFGIGLPPRAWKKKLKNGVLFSLNWLPIGGFVKLQGEHDAADKKGDYGHATNWQKTKILFAGVFSNWIFAAVLISVISLFGMPKIMENQFYLSGDATITKKPVQISALIHGHAAEKAGLKAGDEIIRFNGKEVPNVQALVNYAKEDAGKTISVIYDRNDEEGEASVSLGEPNTEGIFGAALVQQEIIRSTWSAPIVGVVNTAQFSWLTIQGLGQIVASIFTSGVSSVQDSVAGPIGIIGTIFPAAERSGILQLALLTAIISLSLAVMNILPIPALDGGRWVVTMLFKLFKKKLTRETEERIQAIGFYFLMSLIILITISDVGKLFKR